MARTKKSIPTTRCISCSTEFKIGVSDYYKDNNEDLVNVDHCLCKNCAGRWINSSDSLEGLHDILRLINRPFLPEVWEECNRDFTEYMKRLTNVKKKYIDGRLVCELKYKDSPGIPCVTDVDAYLTASNSDEEIIELTAIFGNFDNKTLLTMNRELESMILEFGGSRDSASTVDLYSEMIRLKWKARELIDKGDKESVNTGRSLLSELNKMKKDNKMTAGDMAEKRQVEDFGTEVDYVEDEPIRPDKTWEDFDHIMFVVKYIIEHLARLRGWSKKPVMDDYHEISEYMSEHEEDVVDNG